MTFTYEHIKTQEGVRTHIKDCEGKHTQQAIYSTFHDALTQICFGCQKVRSTIYRDFPSLPQNGDREKEWKCPCSCHDGSGVHFREECPCNQPDSPSEGKEKEPKEDFRHLHPAGKWGEPCQDCIVSALAGGKKKILDTKMNDILQNQSMTLNPPFKAEKEPKTDWEERWNKLKQETLQVLDEAGLPPQYEAVVNAHIEILLNECEAFIQTLLKEKDEEFVKELEDKKVVEVSLPGDNPRVLIWKARHNKTLDELIAKYSPEGNKENTKE